MFNPPLFLLSFTVTTHLYNFFPAFAVMVAFPFLNAVTLPFLFTLATPGLEDFQIIFFPLTPFIFKVCVFDTSMVSFFLLIRTFASVSTHMVNTMAVTVTNAVTANMFFFISSPPN